ncbi:hypothetical protein KSK55_06680 [Methanospirillum purgamenti]|uniref:Uncharacterized protein n=1 Tax=Methanospirillum hungatei TaxID=2203 RepID=A0A8F5VNH9_METHU|nr:hypothetical protein [Methanospirillum hungatei]QXO96049.1 hypothetical protein KSK55_06680 [Methanospirillum hungatei]
MRVSPILLCISVEVLMNIIWSDLTAEVTAGVTALPQLADNMDRSERIRSYLELNIDVMIADKVSSFRITILDPSPWGILRMFRMDMGVHDNFFPIWIACNDLFNSSS